MKWQKPFNTFLSEFKWYRKLVGGTWAEVTPATFSDFSVWVNNWDESFERVNKIEIYKKHQRK
jgi:hypothetical protein